MSSAIQCVCGKRFQAPASLAGKRVKCPSCGDPLAIPKQVAPPATPASAPNTSAQSDAGNSTSIACACGKQFQVPPSLAGKRVKCPTCGGIIEVPLADLDDDPLGLGDAAAFEAAASTLQISRPAAVAPMPSASAAVSNDLDAVPRKRKKVKRRNISEAKAELGRAGAQIFGGIGMFIAGIVASVVSYNMAAPGETYYAMTGLIIGGVITFLYGLMGLVRARNYQSGNVSESGEAGVDRFARNLSFLPVLIISIIVVLGGGFVILMVFF